MRNLWRIARARPRREEGMYTLQLLVVLPIFLGLVMLIVQVTLVFINAIIVNHALALASEEASARGAVDPVVEQVFWKHLPGSVQAQCSPDGLNGPRCLRNSDGLSDTIVKPGTEPVLEDGLAKVRFAYRQDMTLMSWFTRTTPSIDMGRSVQFVSQSVKEN